MLFSLNSYLVSTYICKAQNSTKLLTYSSYNEFGKGYEMDLMLVIDELSNHWFFFFFVKPCFCYEKAIMGSLGRGSAI